MTRSYVLRTYLSADELLSTYVIYTQFSLKVIARTTYIRRGEAIDIGLVEDAVNVGLVG